MTQLQTDRAKEVAAALAALFKKLPVPVVVKVA